MSAIHAVAGDVVAFEAIGRDSRWRCGVGLVQSRNGPRHLDVIVFRRQWVSVGGSDEDGSESDGMSELDTTYTETKNIRTILAAACFCNLGNEDSLIVDQKLRLGDEHVHMIRAAAGLEVGEGSAQTGHDADEVEELAATSAPKFKLNLPVAESSHNDGGYIALPPPTSRKDGINGKEDQSEELAKARALLAEYEEQITSLIEQVEGLRRTTTSPLAAEPPGDTFNAKAVRFSDPMADASSSPAAAAPAGSAASTAQEVVALRKQLRDQRIACDRQVADLKAKNEELQALVSAWKVVVDSASGGAAAGGGGGAAAGGARQMLMDIKTARGELQTARAAYRKTARGRPGGAVESEVAEAHLRAAEGMLDQQEFMMNFIKQAHDRIETVNDGSRTARIRIVEPSAAPAATPPTAGGAMPEAPRRLPPRAGKAPMARPAATESPGSPQRAPPSVPLRRPSMVEDGSGLTPQTSFADPTTPLKESPSQAALASSGQSTGSPLAESAGGLTTDTSGGSRVRVARKGAKSRPKPQSAATPATIHEQFKSACFLLQETAVEAEEEADALRKENEAKAKRLDEMIKELEMIRKLRDQERAQLQTQLQRIEEANTAKATAAAAAAAA